MMTHSSCFAIERAQKHNGSEDAFYDVLKHIFVVTILIFLNIFAKILAFLYIAGENID